MSILMVTFISIGDQTYLYNLKFITAAS